jgi:methylated-DNA-protein-cysteine methyltransferase-like protein
MLSRVDKDFSNRVYELVGQIPKGHVMTYGQIAVLCGAAWAAWEVGQIAHNGSDRLPWQRVVNKQGGLARGWPNGGIAAHRSILEAEGIVVSDDYKVDVVKLLWNPKQIPLL